MKPVYLGWRTATPRRLQTLHSLLRRYPETPLWSLHIQVKDISWDRFCQLLMVTSASGCKSLYLALPSLLLLVCSVICPQLTYSVMYCSLCPASPFQSDLAPFGNGPFTTVLSFAIKHTFALVGLDTTGFDGNIHDKDISRQATRQRYLSPITQHYCFLARIPPIHPEGLLAIVF